MGSSKILRVNIKNSAENSTWGNGDNLTKLITGDMPQGRGDSTTFGTAALNKNSNLIANISGMDRQNENLKST